MEDLSLHILDIAENSIAAGARVICLTVTEDIVTDLLQIEIADDGRGMTPEAVARAVDPFYTTRTTRRIGLGLPLLRHAAELTGGGLQVASTPGAGTTVRATFRLSHVDRQPLGDVAETIIGILANAAGVDVRYRHERNGRIIAFDSEELRSHLGEDPLTSVEALRWIREFLKQEEASLA